MDYHLGNNVTTLLAAAVLTCIVIWLYRHYTLLRRCGFDGPTPWPIVGNAFQLFLRGIKVMDAEWKIKYGNVYGYYVGYMPEISISDPELLKTILVKDFPKFMDRKFADSNGQPKLVNNGLFFMLGRKWKKTRNILTPAFSAGKLKLFAPLLNKCAETLSRHLENNVGEIIDIRQFYIHFTMDAIASTAFGIDVDSQNQPDDPFVANIDPIITIGPSRILYMLLATSFPTVVGLLARLGIHSLPNDSVKFYEKTGQMLIDERKKSKGPRGRVDFIQMLLDAELDISKAEHVQNDTAFTTDVTHDGVTGKHIERLTDDEINGQAFFFFVAGYETTASALRYASYCLAVYPDIDRKLFEEITKELNGAEPTYDNIASLKYMDMFFNEVLRYYPPVARLNRVAVEDVVLDRHRIPKGTAITIPVWLIHHSPENYPDPETFDPERFSKDSKRASTTDRITYLPFGTGPRNCIGMRLALLEAKIALVHILRKIRFVRCEKTQVPLVLKHMVLLRPKSPVQVKLEKR